ncbi:MAG: ATP synthase F0 subunit A, partial [Candidatus Jacksonbacteria bacterium RIFCSPHIGHO2_02_FULL_44_25]
FFPVTNSLLTMWIGMIAIAFVAVYSARTARISPKSLQIVLEAVYEFFLNLCDSVLGNKKLAEKAQPFIATIFIFVLVGNIASVIPGVGSIGFFDQADEFVPLFRPGSADLNTTLALSLISVIIIQIIGFRTLGAGYAKKFFNFSNPMNFFVGILELISEFAKIISFSFRLFGNVFAGEVLLTVMLMLVPYFVPLPFYGLEIFVAFIQAFVFAMLTLVFIKIAMTSHAHEGDSHAHGAAH